MATCDNCGETERHAPGCIHEPVLPVGVPPHIFRTGEECRITYGGRNEPAKVLLGSPNGKSLMLSFDAMLGGYVGMMPVTWHDEPGEFRDLICNLPVQLRPKAMQ